MPWTTYLLLAVAAAAALGAGNVVASWSAGLVRGWLERAGVDPSVRRLAVLAIRPIVLPIAVVAALGYLGVDTGGLVIVLGAATLALGLALRGSVSNLASGGILLSLRPFREGDVVRLAGQDGSVVEQGLYGTTLRTPDGALVTLPNDLVLAGDIHNFTRSGQRRVIVDVTIPREADLDDAIERLLAACRADQRVLASPPPDVVVQGLEPTGVRLAARAWVPAAEWEAARSDLHRGALAALRGVEEPASRARAASRARQPAAVGGER